jgi:nucleotide-binding universal stress UspA family protein
MLFNAILLPIDGSPLSFKPMQAVIALARLAHARLVVLSVAEPALYRSSSADAVHPGSAVEVMHLEAARSNVRTVQAMAETAGVDCESVALVSALPAEEILRTAQQKNCDLIAMATRGEMGIVDTIFSESTTQSVLQKASIPVLVFP